MQGDVIRPTSRLGRKSNEKRDYPWVFDQPKTLNPLVAASIERLFLSRLLSGYGEKECLRWETSRTSCRHASWCIL